jgi:hypothetical protein
VFLPTTEDVKRILRRDALVISQIPQIDKVDWQETSQPSPLALEFQKAFSSGLRRFQLRSPETPLDGPIRNAVRNLIRMLDGPN